MELVAVLEDLKKRMDDASDDGKAWRVVHLLVRETLAAMLRGIERVEFDRAQIVVGCLPGHKVGGVDPKTWVPHIDTLRSVLASQSESLELLYTNPRGGRGKISAYRLQLKATSNEDVESEEEKQPASAQVIRYSRSQPGEIKPSFLARPFLKKELKNRSWSGFIFLFGIVLCGALLCASVPLLFLLSMVYGSAAIELKHLLTLAFISGVFWIVWKYVDGKRPGNTPT